MTGSEAPEPEPDAENASKHEKEAAAEPRAAAAVSEAGAGNSDGTCRGWHLRRPTIVEMAAFVAVVGGSWGSSSHSLQAANRSRLRP